ncbi:MAG TPA: hypothetical protein ENG83_07780 [Nitrospirae bacterium]|nr:putative peptidoglycan biosynthesis protein MurJ [bacterium BMS3Abin06]HDH12080.1 hypothetical protein [Nitrospirota bacterium]HDZ02233.1 hypothetical protein [Nitrospirota bacterium]
MNGIPISISKLLKRVRAKPLVWDTITTTIMSIVGKGIGFLIPFFIAAWFGVSSKTDSFFFAFGLILFLAQMFAPAVESVIVPFITDAIAKNEDVGEFLGRTLGISAVGLSALAVLFLMVIKPVLSILTRFSPDELNLIQTILFETAPLVILLVWTGILSGTLNAYKIFSIPALSPAFRAIVAIAFIFAFKESIGVHAIAWGYVIGEAIRLGILFLFLKKLRLFRLKFSIGWEKSFSQFFRTSSYQIIGLSVLAFTPIINQTMASWLGTGNVSLLEYANRLYLIPTTLMSSGLMVTVLSHWSIDYQTGGEAVLKKNVLNGVKAVGAGGLLLTICIFLAKDYLVSMVYGHGEFPKEQIHEVAQIFGFFLLGLTPFLIALLYSRAFLTKKNTKVLLFTAMIMVMGTIIFNLIFMQIMGIRGIALASSIVAFVSLAVLIFLFHRKTS